MFESAETHERICFIGFLLLQRANPIKNYKDQDIQYQFASYVLSLIGLAHRNSALKKANQTRMVVVVVKCMSHVYITLKCDLKL